ncbi:acyl carrier protein [Micromonospora sp. 4G57]|uniref:Acyl carrier protein n=1 Tax=Micromonospora sicca TaxID=2202420 RepID=A0ABU5JKP2_9ACTN|nr:MULTISPECIES: acyl carrier protein [unclassified Micromonospora]MDZ5443315.1 acyl carrier protein [Micromonospora sp. 4G57]MDZ5493190.1 acyl carrier protein [Micromonospora sp. 4G53]
MTSFTLDDLRELLGSIAGVDESTDLSGDIADVPLADLGYDSLAMLELAGHVQRCYGVPIPDEAVERMTTPRGTVDYINAQFATVG